MKVVSFQFESSRGYFSRQERYLWLHRPFPRLLLVTGAMFLVTSDRPGMTFVDKELHFKQFLFYPILTVGITLGHHPRGQHSRGLPCRELQSRGGSIWVTSIDFLELSFVLSFIVGEILAGDSIPGYTITGDRIPWDNIRREQHSRSIANRVPHAQGYYAVGGRRISWKSLLPGETRDNLIRSCLLPTCRVCQLGDFLALGHRRSHL